MNAIVRSAIDPRHSPEAIAERILPSERRRGRGAATNASGRFEVQKREDFDDGWTREEAPEPLMTEVTWEKPKNIIARNESPDIPFDRSINPYRGCEHGCFYCYARPTHAYMGLSAGLDFETKLFAKQGAAELLERELASPKYRPAPIAFGANTDPYQPIERQYRITRSLIEVLEAGRPSAHHRHQIEPHFARSRPPGPDGPRRPRQGLRLGDHARSRAGAKDGAARADAAEKARGDRGAQRRRRAGGRDGGARDSRDQRRGAGDDFDPSLRRRRARGELCRPPAAGRVARHVPRMAASPLSRPAQARRLAHAVDARGQGLRGPMGPAHGGLGSLRLDDRAPLRDGCAAPRL